MHDQNIVMVKERTEMLLKYVNVLISRGISDVQIICLVLNSGSVVFYCSCLDECSGRVLYCQVEAQHTSTKTCNWTIKQRSSKEKNVLTNDNGIKTLTETLKCEVLLSCIV